MSETAVYALYSFYLLVFCFVLFFVVDNRLNFCAADVPERQVVTAQRI